MKLRLMSVALVCMVMMAGCTSRKYDGEIHLKGESYRLYMEGGRLYVDFGDEVTDVGDELVFDFRAFDMDGDECDEIVILTKGSGDSGSDVVIFEVEPGETREVYRKDFSSVKPWNVDACDVDGDGWGEVFIGVFKDTRYFKEVRRRPFFYTWDGKALRKKWEGSAFSSRYLIDITFGDYFNMGRDLAAVLEKDGEGKCYVSIYISADFGFTKVTESEPMEDIIAVETLYSSEGESVMAVTDDGKQISNLNFVKSMHVDKVQ